MWVQNRVIEINRLTDASLWWYVDSNNMVADLGTREWADISDVGPDSEWIMGQEWMRCREQDFPIKSAADLSLDASEMQATRKESIVIEDID